MIKIDAIIMQKELYECSLKNGANEVCAALDEWWKKWVKDLHVRHTFDKELINRPDYKGFREHQHRSMLMQIGEEIGRAKYAVLEHNKEFDSEDPHAFHPHVIDEITVYVLGRP